MESARDAYAEHTADQQAIYTNRHEELGIAL